MQVFSQKPRRNKLVLTSIPSTFEGTQNLYKYGCIKCSDPGCVSIPLDKISISGIDNFANNQDPSTCPVHAIHWNFSEEVPFIENSSCIHCGLCCMRCPVNVIDPISCSIRTNLSGGQRLSNCDKLNVDLQNQQIKILKRNHENYIPFDFDKLLDLAQKRLQEMDEQYRNLLVRNILIGLGMHAMTSRIGDVANRIDVIFEKDGLYGIGEVEFGTDTLSAARGVLDDIAMLSYKHKIQKTKIGAWVILLTLPNRRQDYWNVIKDIKNVLKIRINTITIGALFVLLWNRCFINPCEDSFYIDYDNVSIRGAVEKKIHQKLHLAHEHPGIFEPLK